MDARRLLEHAAEANRAALHRRAVQLCNLGLNARPQLALECSLRFERAVALVQTSDHRRAEPDCRRVLAQHENLRARVLLARCLLEREQAGEALENIELALATDPEPAESWQLLARALSALGRHDGAVTAAQEARRRDPRASLRTFVRVLAAAGRDAELSLALEHELTLAPHDAELWTALGLSSNARGRSEAAVAAFRRAVALDPGRVDAHCGLGQALLRLGHLEEGFRHHEHRQKRAGDCRRYAVAPWQGEPLEGKHLIVWSEQGFGDTLQFVRFLPAVRRLAERTTLFVAPALLSLFRSTPALGAIESQNPGFGASDYQTLLMSLPHLLQLGNDVGSAALPLFVPDPERVARWRARLPPGLKVALAWQGNPKYGGEPWRSMPFAELAPLLARFQDRVSFVSLQKYFGSEQLRTATFPHRVIDLSDELDANGDAFVDSLAILSMVDLFLTTDTALAHLAGSAGARTWVLLSEVADWRWGVGTDTSVWYPSSRLFRQTIGADWKGVIERVSHELGAVVTAAPSAHPELGARAVGAGGGAPGYHSGSKSQALCSMPPQVVGTGA